jgi:DNA-binding SARP family transcriptional activator
LIAGDPVGTVRFVTSVRVHLAGQFAMTVGKGGVNTARLARRDTHLLAYLVLERGRRVAQSELAGILWESRLPATWKTSLRGSVSRVRSDRGSTIPP